MSSIELGRTEIYLPSPNIWSFKQVDDIVNGIALRITNMAGGYPFECGGKVWSESERVYLCGEFSHNPDEHLSIYIQRELCRAKSGYAAMNESSIRIMQSACFHQ